MGRLPYWFEQLPDEFVINVEDDGIGITRGGETSPGNGLKGMRERLEFINGSLRVEGGEGTKLSIRVPAVLNILWRVIDMIRIVIAEDQGMMLGALGSLLNLEEDMEVVGKAKNGEEAVALVKEQQPDVCIMDIEMPVKTGLDAAEALHGETVKLSF